jgi:hypothetical protein
MGGARHAYSLAFRMEFEGLLPSTAFIGGTCSVFRRTLEASLNFLQPRIDWRASRETVRLKNNLYTFF